jgi:hypothetical protein
MSPMWDVISVYSLEQALADGVLVKVFDETFEPYIKQHTGGKPVVATAHLVAKISHADFLDLWKQYIVWREKVMPTLPEEERMFVAEINGKVWVDETDSQITLMLPEDY